MKRFRAADLAHDRKEGGGLVTDADRSIELALRERVRNSHSADSFLGEELGEDGSGCRTWMIDPIDGTVAFSEGDIQWATLIGLCEEGVPTVGVVSAPAQRRRWWGAFGLGAWANGGPISVSATSDLASAVIAEDYRHTVRDRLEENPLVAIAERCARTSELTDVGGILQVAQGDIDLNFAWYVGNGPDLASHVGVLRAAGGRFEDLHGRIDIDSQVWLASNSILHDEVMAIVRDLVASGAVDPGRRPVDPEGWAPP